MVLTAKDGLKVNKKILLSIWDNRFKEMMYKF